MSIIFADAWLITMNEQREVLESASVCVEKDRIVAVGTRNDLRKALSRGRSCGLQGTHRDAGNGEHAHASFPDAAEGPWRRHGAEEVVHLHDGAERRAPHARRRARRRAARMRRIDSLGRHDACRFHVRPHAAGHDQGRRGGVRRKPGCAVLSAADSFLSAKNTAFRAS